MAPGFEIVLADLLVHVVRVEASGGYGDTRSGIFSGQFLKVVGLDEAIIERLLGDSSFSSFAPDTSNLRWSVSQTMLRIIRWVFRLIRTSLLLQIIM